MENQNHEKSNPESIPLVTRRINVAPREDQGGNHPQSDTAPAVDPTVQGGSFQGSVVPLVNVDVDGNSGRNSRSIALNLDERGGGIESNEDPTVNEGVNEDDVTIALNSDDDSEETVPTPLD